MMMLAATAGLLLVAGCASAGGADAPRGTIAAVGAENQYANVISQVGGRYVSVTAIMSSPATDPHTFEASPSVARAVAGARLVVQNGLGYDAFMNRIESATPNPGRRVIDVHTLLGLPGSTANPHLWYSPHTMPAVAQALVRNLSALQPRHAAYFAANARRFEASLKPWYAALRRFAARYPHAPVATTEPVGDAMLQAAGTVDRTPFGLQADLMNGVDPAPQDITLQNNLLSRRRVRALVYNQQVTDSLTDSFLTTARRHRVPVVGIYETMPTGYDYQAWMLAETNALRRAVADGVSTTRLR